MINIFTRAAESKTTITQTISHDIAGHMDEKIWRDVIDKLTDLWVREYGPALLKEITPKQMKLALKKHLEEQLAERILRL